MTRSVKYFVPTRAWEQARKDMECIIRDDALHISEWKCPTIHPLFFSKFPGFLSGYNLNLLNLREFVTTDTELNAMAPAAIMGLRRPSAARGIARTL